MIPKTLHYCWFGKHPKPSSFAACLESWKKHCPGFQITEWNETNAPNKEQHFYKNAIRKKQYAFVADCVRARVLLTEGGIYLDTDMLLLKSLESFLSYKFFIGEEVSGRINFALFGSEKNHPFLAKIDAFYNNTEFNSFSPPVITHTFSPLINIKTLNSNDKILPPDYFYPLAYEDKEEKYLKYTTLNSHAVHLWEHSWKPKKTETTSQLLKNLITVGNDYLFHGYSIPYVKRYGKEFSRKLYHKLFGKNKTAKPQPSTINQQPSTSKKSPKIVHITTSYKGGAGIAALRLHRALREAGVASAFLSKDFTEDFEGNKIENNFFAYSRPGTFRKIKNKITQLFFPSDRQNILKDYNLTKAKINSEITTMPISNFSLHAHPLVREANLINLHWVGLILDYEKFFSAVKKPIVWTLHDMNPFLGLYHYQGDVDRNKNIASQLNNAVFEFKAKSIKRIINGAIVSPSHWLLEQAEFSKVFSHFKVKKTIPNSIDLDIFTPQDRSDSLREFGIAADELLLLFISDNLQNPRKGFGLLMDAFKKISIPLTVLIIGEGEIGALGKNIKTVPLGKVSSPQKMAKYYNLADVFILPSREDNLPNVILESFSCGTPVIGFKVGGMKEHIKEELNGILAENISAESLSRAIEKFHSNKEKYSAQKIREYAENHFSFKKQAEAYIQVYDTLLK